MSTFTKKKQIEAQYTNLVTGDNTVTSVHSDSLIQRVDTTTDLNFV